MKPSVKKKSSSASVSLKDVCFCFERDLRCLHTRLQSWRVTLKLGNRIWAHCTLVFPIRLSPDISYMFTCTMRTRLQSWQVTLKLGNRIWGDCTLCCQPVLAHVSNKTQSWHDHLNMFSFKREIFHWRRQEVIDCTGGSFNWNHPARILNNLVDNMIFNDMFLEKV